LVVGTAPPERAGSAAAISETSSELGGALGIAILGTIGTALYRGQVAEEIPPGVPPDAADAARDTLGGAVGAAAQLPDPLAAELLDAAREAFTLGLQVAALTRAVIAAATAVVAAVLLRRVGAEVHREEGRHPGLRKPPMPRGREALLRQLGRDHVRLLDVRRAGEQLVRLAHERLGNPA
jgi:hypothetical protein